MTADDRDEFEVMKRDQATAMADDDDLNERARELLVAADRHGWSYQWTWLGLPIIQLPTDIVAMQEIIWTQQPDLVIETGVARGGSLILSASILQLLGHGHVVGIDVDIRAHNREAIESHPLAGRITLLEGSSVDTELVRRVTEHASGCDRVMVVLDSNHTHAHVLAELDAYAQLVTVGQYLVVCDTVVEELPPQDHRPRPWGPGDNPATALAEFQLDHPEFEPDDQLHRRLLLTSSPGGYLRRVGAAAP
jgi:cephalosporin hydroxylase